MLKTRRKPSSIFLFSFTFLLIFLLWLPWVNAKEAPKPKPQDWQLNGIIAAIDDIYPGVQGLAFNKLVEYQLKDLDKQKLENIAKKAASVLKDEKVDANLRTSAISALGNFGEAAKSYIPDILAILKDEKADANVRNGAALALGNFGEAAKSYIPDILAILKDEKADANVRAGAASALGNFGEAAKSYIPDILAFLKNEKVDANVRGNAASALENFGEAAKSYIPDILAILKDEKVNTSVRYFAASGLGNFGEAAKSYIPDIFAILKDEKVNANVRSSAAYGLRNFGEAAKSYIPDILAILKDNKVDINLRSNAASALGNSGSKSYISDILAIIKDEKVDINLRSNAAKELFKIKQLILEQVLDVLDLFYRSGESEWNEWRFLTYLTSGGTDEVKTLLKYLAHYDHKKAEAQLQQVNYDEAKTALQLFAKVWKPSEGMRLRDDLAKQIAEVADKVTWKAGDIALLQSHYNNLKQSGYKQYDTVGRIIQNLEYWKWIFRARNIILIHLAFWLALIFLYPKSPEIQAIFFWNPWVRRILGMGYVGFLLTWVPFFRRKLLEPFKFSLLADAGLDNFNPAGYFPSSNITGTQNVETRNYGSLDDNRQIQSITAIIPKIAGQIVLEGDSGLGKSMFLRHLLKTSQRIVVYLPAQKCDKGVIEAIQIKLHGQAQDADFLKNLIYSGAIDICIDGLNEVTADTRAKICQFVESYFQGNIIMTTQPLEWTPPKTAKTYYLQPLTPNQIEQFLLSRTLRLPQDAKLQGADYEKACKIYLAEALKPELSKEELAANLRILSNPMDLTVVSLMMAQGNQPNLFNLQQQQYNLMAAEYQHEWKHEFPLKKFSAAVYDLRLNDQQALSVDDFHQELLSMEDDKYKMVVSRQWLDNSSEAKKEWYFRHDKIMEFFLVQNFLGDGDQAESRLINHMGDPRFRGVYFLLGTLLPLDAAKELREKLIQYAADTKDHTVSDTFVQLLRIR
jgi:HEAT repeat protein